MKNTKPRRKLRSVLRWVAWVLLVQFILINISASLYAYKFTHLHAGNGGAVIEPSPKNIFSKTWRLFAGPKFYRQPLIKTPTFDYVTLSLKTAKDFSLEAWYSSADSMGKGTVILFHGLGMNKGAILDEALVFRQWGYGVLLVDARSHGNSGGNITTIGYKEAGDVKLAYDYLEGKGEKNIFLWGVSMGAVEIIRAVAEYHLQPAGIILETPFLSLQSHLKGRARTLGFPAQPFTFFTTFWIGAENGFNGFAFEATRYAKQVNCPVLYQYGDKDELVLKYETNAVYESMASKNKKLVIYDDAQHESFVRKDPAAWKKEVKAFLEKIAGPTSGS